MNKILFISLAFVFISCSKDRPKDSSKLKLDQTVYYSYDDAVILTQIYQKDGQVFEYVRSSDSLYTSGDIFDKNFERGLTLNLSEQHPRLYYKGKKVNLPKDGTLLFFTRDKVFKMKHKNTSALKIIDNDNLNTNVYRRKKIK